MTRLQLAVDLTSIEDFALVLGPLLPLVDILEAGTPLIKKYGLDSVRGLRSLAPNHLLVADMKAMDAGGLEAEMAFAAGADMMTVLACASDATVSAAVAVAGDNGRLVVADLIGVADKVARARQLISLGVTHLGIHTGTDDQATGANPLADLMAVQAAISVQTVVAGGINAGTLPAILAQRPAIVIVGSGILGADDPVVAATELRELLDAHRSRQ